MASTLDLMSFITRSRSAPSMISTTTAATFSAAVERMSSMPSIALDRFLDPHHDALFDLLGRGAGIGHRDSDHVDRELREDLLLDAAHGHQAADDDQHHQEVGGDAVSGEPSNRAVHDRISFEGRRRERRGRRS